MHMASAAARGLCYSIQVDKVGTATMASTERYANQGKDAHARRIFCARTRQVAVPGVGGIRWAAVTVTATESTAVRLLNIGMLRMRAAVACVH